MGTKCSCNIMEVTNLNFGEDSDIKCININIKRISYTLSSSEDTEGTDYEYETNADETDTDEQSSTSYSISNKEYDTKSRQNCNNKRLVSIPNKSSSHGSNINPAEGAGEYGYGSSVTDVSDLTNSDLDDMSVGSSSIMSTSTSVSVSTTHSSSSSEQTPIPAPSPLEIIRAVQMKQNLIHDQIQQRRHSMPMHNLLPNPSNDYWNIPRSMSDRVEIHGPPYHRFTQSGPQENIWIPPKTKAQMDMDRMTESRSVDIQNILNPNINIEDLYEQNSDEPINIYPQFNSSKSNPSPNMNMNVMAAINYAKAVSAPSPQLKANTITVEPNTYLSNNSTNSIEPNLITKITKMRM